MTDDTVKKFCKTCNAVTERNKHGRNGKGCCKPCAARRNAKWYAKNREAIRARYATTSAKRNKALRKRYRSDDEYQLRYWRGVLKSNYSLTVEAYVEMYVAQRGMCKLCSQRLW